MRGSIVDLWVSCEMATCFVHTNDQIRVCRLCGYAEEGWGCGYYKLFPNICDLGLPFDENALDHIRVFKTQEELNEKRFGK